MPKHIDPDAIYTKDELHEILHGAAKIETLRRFGLVALPGAGYFGRNVLDALDAWCRGERTDRAVHEDNPEMPSNRRAVTTPHHSGKGKAGHAGFTEGSQKSETQSQKLRRLWREEQEARKRK